MRASANTLRSASTDFHRHKGRQAQNYKIPTREHRRYPVNSSATKCGRSIPEGHGTVHGFIGDGFVGRGRARYPSHARKNLFRRLRPRGFGSLVAHRDKLLGCRRMNTDRGVEIRFRGPHLHRNTDPLDNLGRVDTDHMRTDHPL
jgi:hypothetical protein